MRVFLAGIFLAVFIREYHFTDRTQEATYQCSANSTDVSLLHFTFRLLSKNDTVVELIAYDAASTVVGNGRKENCKSTGGNGTDSNPFELAITIDTDNSVSISAQKSLCGIQETSAPLKTIQYQKCATGALVYTSSIYCYKVQSGRIFKFRIRSVGDLSLDLGTDAFYDCECDKNNLLAEWKSAGPIFTRGIQSIELQQSPIGASLRIMNALTNLPITMVELGAEVYLQVLYNPKTNEENPYDSCGREFWITFLDIGYTVSPTLLLRIISASTVKSKITLWKSDSEEIVQSVTVNPLSETRVSLPYSYFQSLSKEKGILVKSTENIYLMAESTESGKTTLCTLYPYDTLGSNYEIIAGNTTKRIGIISTKDSTNISILSPITFDVDGETKPANTPVTFVLHRFQTLYLNATDDITGIQVQSTASIALFTGNELNSSDFVFEQLFSNKKLGSEFLVIPGNGTVKCVAMESGTTTFRYKDVTSNSDVSLQRIQHTCLEIPVHALVFFEINTDKRVSCLYDITMASSLLPSKHQWSSFYTFSIDITKASKTVLQIVIENGTETGLLINDNTLTTSEWKPVAFLLKNSFASNLIGTTYTLSASSGSPIRLFHATVTFMAVLVTGDSTYMSATVPPGIRISDLYSSGDPSCKKTTGYRGDLVDNDCDGYVDEDSSVNAITSRLDLKANVIENINPLGVRPVACVAKPNSAWTDGGTSKTVTDNSGCLPTGSDANPFTPTTTFKLMSTVGKYPAVYNSGSFKMARFRNIADVFFRCMISFCFRFDDASCSTQICRGKRRKRSSFSNQQSLADIQAQVTVTDQSADQENYNITNNDTVVQSECYRDFKFLLVVSLMAVVLFTALLFTLYLHRKVKIKLK